jgi:hypothetical protein
MRTIWKFPLKLVDGRQPIQMPCDAVLLHVAMQGDSPCIWAMVDPENARMPRGFAVVGTGHRIPNGSSYVGTCQHGDALVWHVFETEAR